MKVRTISIAAFFITGYIGWWGLLPIAVLIIIDIGMWIKG